MISHLKILFITIIGLFLVSCSTTDTEKDQDIAVKPATYPNLIGQYQRTVQVQNLKDNCQKAFGIDDSTAYDNFKQSFKDAEVQDSLEIFQSKNKIGYKYQNLEILGTVTYEGEIQLTETSLGSKSQCAGSVTDAGFELLCVGDITYHDNKPLANECTIEAKHIAIRK